MFYARALFALCFIGLVFMTAFAGVAMAQEAGPVTVDQIAAPVADEGYTGIAGLANTALTGLASGLALLIAAVVTRLWNMFPVWAQAAIDKMTTTDSKEWRENVREAAYDALMHATVKLKIDPKSIQSWEEKSAFLTLAGQFITRFDPDIKALVDKDGDGIPDILEIALAKIAPNTAMIGKPELAQGFMAAVDPQPRAAKRDADKAIQAFAAKYAPKRAKAGTVQ
ncbi:MAG TPA: hypothetical protein DCL48_12105 [Alphaproteobacteria bacterium]|nr:hypothetical protein [Alphaproteobacteria bacterium]